MKTRDKITKLLSQADININGDRLWDIQVHHDALFKRVLSQGSLGLGEAYMDGWWDCQRIDVMIEKLIKAELEKKVRGSSIIWEIVKAKLFNRQSAKRAWQVGQIHYDLGNELYQAMLDRRLNYSCGYWRRAANLDEAQLAKLELSCRKLQLKPGMTVLDIGCGWGAFAKYAAEKYDVKVLGVTISKKQARLARQLCQDLPVEIKLQDYRSLNGKFDAVISIGMFEHVGYKNYHEYMRTVSSLLKNEGLFLLHTIGGNVSVCSTDPWIEKYIFPNSMLPSPKQITESVEGLFVIEDWHNFGTDYDRTLMAWHKNFIAAWPRLKNLYDERFFRMWSYYLLTCAGTFRARKNQLWQIVLSKHGQPGGYKSIR